MSRFALIVLLSSLLLTLPFMYKGNIPKVKVSSDIHQGDLVLTGNNVTVIEGQFDINGSILVEENATLILRNAVLNFTQARDYQFNMTFSNPTNGNPRLIAENTTLATAYSFRVRFHGNSSCRADRLEVWPPYAAGYWWYMYDSSVVSISTSRVYMVAAYVDSIFEAFNSTMRYMDAVGQVSANISLSYIESLYCDSSSAVNVSSSNIWQLETKASAVATASNSTINNLYTYQSSVARLVNSSYTSYSIYNESKVFVCWYLNVHVTDLEGTDVPSANVTAKYSDATVAESKLTDANGWTRLTLIEKMTNATDSYPIGNYTTTAKYEVHTGQKSVNMTGNKEITISLPFIIPEFSSFLVLPLFMIATLLVVIVYRRKRSAVPKQRID
jgi:hypothetical protein